MHNPFLAEHCLVLDGQSVTLKLNLGALAALESALGAQSLSDVLARFAQSEVKAEDIIHVLNAGLYGAGVTGDIRKMEIEGGAARAALVARELLNSALQDLQYAIAL